MIKGKGANYFASILIGIFHYTYLLFSRKKYVYLGGYIPSSETPGILSCWHENAFISLSLRGKDISILVSKSKDGDLHAESLFLMAGRPFEETPKGRSA